MIKQNMKTMKTLKFNKIILLLLGLVVFNGCVEDDDFNAPNTSIVEPNIPTNAKVQISAVAGELAQAQGGSTLNYNSDDDVYTYAYNTNDIYMEGYVVSSDESGNFFEELIIQDKAENPTIGIKLLIDVNPLFVRYEVGRKVYVKLNGLSVGITNGVLTLGALNGDNVDKISPTEETRVIMRSAEKATLVPMPLAFSAIENSKTNLYVKLEDVQFLKSQVEGSSAMSYASESGDQFDGERTLESCDGSSVVFSTSTFADFKGLSLPAGRGSMNAILTKNYFGNAFNIVINSPEDVDFSGNRCDPVFSEDFQSGTDNTNLDLEGWINYAEAGGEVWTEDVYQGNGTARFSAYNTGDSSNIGWLITPGIDMDAQDNEMLTFQMQHAYPDSGHDPIDVLISTDFDGTETGVTSATWTSVGAFTKSYIEDSGTWFTFVNSGNIDLSSYTGTAYIAFRYTGSDTANQNMTIDIDNIKISVP